MLTYCVIRSSRGTYSPDDAYNDGAACTEAIEPFRHFVGTKSWVRIFSNVTTYSSRYSETTFQAIPLGATMAQVQTALGDPLNRSMAPGGGEIWMYSEQGDPRKDYLVRGFEFSKERIVTDKLSDFMID